MWDTYQKSLIRYIPLNRFLIALERIACISISWSIKAVEGSSAWFGYRYLQIIHRVNLICQRSLFSESQSFHFIDGVEVGFYQSFNLKTFVVGIGVQEQNLILFTLNHHLVTIHTYHHLKNIKQFFDWGFECRDLTTCINLISIFGKLLGLTISTKPWS